tara:strand:+ start:4470 stop:4919 length:450 start_codon:yes stop_codon:yes gene_type:complete
MPRPRYDIFLNKLAEEGVSSVEFEVLSANVDTLSADVAELSATVDSLSGGIPGEGVPIGGTSRQVLAKINSTYYNTFWRSNWYDYSMNVEYTGVETTIATGTVFECIIDSTTIYRFVNSTNNPNGYPIEDSFYETFSNPNLTNLLVSRG